MNATHFLRWEHMVWPWLVAMAYVILSATPPHMDGYNHYHALACWQYPNSVLHAYREPCNGMLNLKLWGGIEWPRSYSYVGAAYSLIYYPLFLIWPSLHSTVLLGIVLMAASVAFASRVLAVPATLAVMVMCGAFPILLYTLRDFGQITIQFLLLFLLPWLVYRTLRAEKRSAWVALSLLTGFMFALGVESKPVLVYYVPSMVIVTLALCWPLSPNTKLVRLMAERLWPGIVLAAVLLTWLLTGAGYDGVPYYAQLTGMVPDHQDTARSWAHMWSLPRKYLLNFPNAVDNMYGLTGLDGILVTLPFWALLGVAAFFYYRYRGDRKRMVCGLLAAFAAGVLIIGTDLHAINPHHILQPFYYLLGALAIMLHVIYARSKRLFAVLAVSFMVTQVACVIFSATRPYPPNHDWNRIEVLEFIADHELAERAVINHLDWGSYYISALYGPKTQLVTFQAPYYATLRMSHTLRRGIVFIFRADHEASYSASLTRYFTRLRKVYPEAGQTSTWQIWTNVPL